jgi:integrase
MVSDVIRAKTNEIVPEPVRTAQQILGHASAQTTFAYYVQSVEELQRSAILRLEKIMFPSWGQAPS